MKKTVDIFANYKALILDTDFLSKIDADVFNHTAREYQTTSCGITLTLRVTSLCEGVRLFNIAKSEDNDMDIKTYCKEQKSYACIKAYFRAMVDNVDYWVVKAFIPTEDGFNKACHWLDNQRYMLMDRIEDWHGEKTIIYNH